MFNGNHYIPIIRWKGAEKQALDKLNSKDKEFVTPLIQIIMPVIKVDKENPITVSDQLDESIKILKGKFSEISKEILKFWGPTPAFIDVSLIDSSLRQEGYEKIIKTSNELGIQLVPVIDLNADSQLQATVVALSKKYGTGLCLRLSESDFKDPTVIKPNVYSFQKKHMISDKSIDLLLDFKITDDSQYSQIENICANIPRLSDWRTFTVASGAFPPDLTEFKNPDLYRISRKDWLNWIKYTRGLKRKPSFADYTIQHPIYKDPIPFSNPSASIRYTTHEEWLIMKGQGLRSPKSSGHKQYPANAQLLSSHPEFFGPSFSYGDSIISEKGKDLKTKKTGNPTTWLLVGINHHITCTVSQISSLS